MNEQALINELRKPEYQGLSDQDAADAINAKTVVARRRLFSFLRLNIVNPAPDCRSGRFLDSLIPSA